MLGYLLDEAHVVDLPLNCGSRLAANLLLSGLVFARLASQSCVLAHASHGHPLLHIDFKNLGEEVIEQHLLLPASEKTFDLDVVVEPEARFAPAHNILQNVNACVDH